VPEPCFECVPNVSEGRDHAVVERCASAVRAVRGVTLMHVHADPDHHRTVFSFLGAAAAVEAAALALAGTALAAIDMRLHRGVHPRVGALDVVPFVPLGGASMDGAVALARRVGDAIAARFSLPVWYYGRAATRPGRESPRALRRGEYEGLAARLASGAPADAPDAGPARFDPRAGGVLVGARDVLVAFNVWLDADDVDAARAIARALRESSGGLPAVQAMGVRLASRGVAQVSMNLLDYRRTPIPAAFDAVVAWASRRGVGVARAELVGVAPRDAFAGRDPATVGLADFTDARLLETYL
jgi:glutamate formiminotransferase